jgi:hypothetical protein
MMPSVPLATTDAEISLDRRQEFVCYQDLDRDTPPGWTSRH